MILLLVLKKNFSLIGKGFYYFRIVNYMLDISSPKSSSYLCLSYIAHISATCVKLCSLYQTKVLYEKNR
jgi:hypothetical protein